MSSERARGDRVAIGVAISTIAIATAWLFAPLIVGALSGRPRFFEWDVPEQYWGDLVYLCRSLHEGELPAWNPYDRAGYPYYADPQAAAYHPISWAICALAGPSPDLAWQEARVVLGFLIAGLGGLLWLRRLDASWPAATLGAITIESAPFMRNSWELNLSSALAFLPLVLWGLERVLMERRARDGAWLAIAIGLLVWTGSPPALWLSIGFTTIYAIGRIVEIARSERREALAIARPLAIAALLALALAAVVLVPGLTLSRHSVQAGRSYESIVEGSLALGDLIALVWPQPGNHLYVGWIALALAPLAFLRSPALPGRIALAIAAIAAVLMAIGENGPLFRIAYHLVPGVRMFRAPMRYEAWLGPAAGALAAGGLDAIRQRLEAMRQPSYAPMAALATVLGIGWMVIGEGFAPAALGIGTGVVLAAALVHDPRAWIAAGSILALTSLFDAGQRLSDHRHTRPRPAPGGDTIARQVLSRAPGTDGAWRYLDEFGISCRSGTRHGRRDLRGYQDPLLLASYERVMAALREHPELAMQFGVRYALTGPHFIHGWDRHYLPPPAVLRSLEGAIDRGHGVIELTRAIPIAYLVPGDRVERVATREEALARTIELAPARIAIVEEGSSPPAPGPERAPIVDARLLRFERDALALELPAESPSGTLVVNEAWYPGWRARVDGRDVEIHRANGLVRAIEVPAGARLVELAFEPADAPIVRAMLVLGWIIAIALLAWPQRLKVRA